MKEISEVPYNHQLQTTDAPFLDNLALPGVAGRELATAPAGGRDGGGLCNRGRSLSHAQVAVLVVLFAWLTLA